MPGATNHPSSLSEISHLFLSSLREKQTGGAPRPRRIPPRKEPSVDLTPEEFDRVLKPPADESSAGVPPVKALLGAHFGARQLDVARQYGASLAASGMRVGLIAVDAGAFHVITFEAGDPDQGPETPQTHTFDAREIRDAINELNCDLDLWLLLVINPRLPESRNLLRNTACWTLLAGPEHESIVAAYRTLKGVEEIGRPRLSIAAAGTRSAADADAVFRRLAGVAAQFLQWSAEPEAPIGTGDGVCSCTVIDIDGGNEKSQMASDAHWQVVEELLAQARFAPPAVIPAPAAPVADETTCEELPGLGEAPMHEPPEDDVPELVERFVMPAAEQEPEPAMTANTSGPRLVGDAGELDPYTEVIELSDPSGSADGILDAVVQHCGGELAQCPVRPPMCPSARLAVTRDRRLMLLAVAGQGLGELRGIGLAFRWLSENRQLLAMALPQFALDTRQLPGLRLMVDHADANAELLQPLFAISTVQIQTYRRVRWAGRTGLLLEAA